MVCVCVWGCGGVCVCVHAWVCVCVWDGGGGGGNNPLGMYHYLKSEGLDVLFLPEVVSNLKVEKNSYRAFI